MKLYDGLKNPNSRKIHAIAFELGLELEIIPVNLMAGEGQKPEFLKLNPNGKVPTLADDQTNVWESNAIMLYLSSNYGQGKFIPKDPVARSQMDQWLFWQTAHMQAAVGKIIMERIYKKKYSMGAENPSALEQGLSEFERYAGVLNGYLADHPFVAGEDLTLADFAIAGSFGYRNEAGLNLEPWEYLKRWLKTVEDRPSWKKATILTPVP